MMKELINEDPEKILDFLDEIGRLAPPELKQSLLGGVIMKKKTNDFKRLQAKTALGFQKIDESFVQLSQPSIYEYLVETR